MQISLPPWTPFTDVTHTVVNVAAPHLSPAELFRLSWGDRAPHVRVYKNSRYTVHKAPFDLTYPDGSVRPGFELSIKTNERDTRHDWREFQRIKNELCGPEYEGCELYPAESRLVDTSNQYYMFVLPAGERFPFGFKDRAVMEGDDGPTRQRPFEQGTRPPDVTSRTIASAIRAQAQKNLREERARAQDEASSSDVGRGNQPVRDVPVLADPQVGQDQAAGDVSHAQSEHGGRAG